ncbi:MAG TPA: glycerophosphodiester phosphodiesterase [Baekduia sp.]|nr:glycerophosphodiester phosphodiesterase [Baekduia sp.]
MGATAQVIAHRGASAQAPEHTFAAFDLALEQGADVLELDVRLTADGRPVVLHDATLERTTGLVAAIADTPSWALPRGTGPLLLDDVFGRYGDATAWLLELKDAEPGLVAGVLEAIARHRLAGRCTVQSFEHAALRRVRVAAPAFAVAPLLRPGLPARVRRDAVARAGRWAAGIGVAHHEADAALILHAHARGLAVRCWTANARPDLERLVALGVDGLVTDVPDLARAVVDAAAVRAA